MYEEVLVFRALEGLFGLFVQEKLREKNLGASTANYAM